ncbi:MAG: ABC transporter ATP-binding protein [Desulfuromonadales bacterium]
MATVKLEKISKGYGKKHVLQDFTLEIRDGECFTLLGPSGCGKTVVMRMVAGFENPDEGAIFIGERQVSGVGTYSIPPEERSIGVVFQEYAVWPHMSVFENVAYPLKMQKCHKDELEKRTRTVLEMTGLGALDSRMPSQLSGGQQQRVALARALVSRPLVMLLDEPVSNLDANLREEMRFEIKELQKETGVTILYVTHDQDVALAIADRIGIMDNAGNMRQVGTPHEIYDDPVDSFVFRFMGIANFLPATRRDTGVCLDGCEVPLENRLCEGFDAVNEGGPVMAGFRPFEVDMQRRSGGVQAVVKRVALLGAMIDYRLEAGGHEIRIQQDTALALRSGGIYKEGDYCRLDFEKLRWFNRQKVEREGDRI